MKGEDMGCDTHRVWTESGLFLCIPGPHGGLEYDGPYGSRNAPREAIFEHVRVRGHRKLLGGRRRIELRSTSPFRSASAKYMLSDSRPFPVATKDDMCPPILNRPVAAFGTTLFVRQERVGAGLYGPFSARFSRASRKSKETRRPHRASIPIGGRAKRANPEWERVRGAQDGKGFHPRGRRNGALRHFAKT